MTLPYTYRIKWSKLNLSYYGVRLKPKCDADIWKHYFTSSYRVKELRIEFGDPDIIEVRKTFLNEDAAIKWEQRVLKRLKVRKNDSWLNVYDGSYYGSTKPKSVEHRRKISIANRGKPHPWAIASNKNPIKIAKTAEKHRGMKRSEKTKERQSVKKKEFIERNGGPSNKGKRFFYDPNDLNNVIQCFPKDAPIGWSNGDPRLIGKACFINLETKEKKRFIKGEEPKNWVLWNPNKKFI